MELLDRNDSGEALAVDRLDLGIERPHRDRHIRWMRRDAVLAGAQDRVNAVEAGKRRAAGARTTLVAGFCDVVEIIAAGSLEQIAAGRGLVAQLRAGTSQQRTAEDAITLPHAPVGGEIAIANQRSNAQAAIGGVFDLVERQAVDIDQL